MQRTRFVEHRGERILLMDFSHLRDPAEIFREIEAAKAFISALPRRKELRTLTDGTGSRYDADMLRALKELAAYATPYVAAAAVVTPSKLRRLGIRAAAAAAGYEVQPFAEVDAAKEWLAARRPATVR